MSEKSSQKSSTDVETEEAASEDQGDQAPSYGIVGGWENGGWRSNAPLEAVPRSYSDDEIQTRRQNAGLPPAEATAE